MEINLFKRISNTIDKIDIKSFIKQLTERLSNMERELVVDGIENNIAVCEDRNTKEMINIDLKELPDNVIEGSVIKSQNGRYILDEKKQEEIQKRIENKMNDIWN